MASAPERKETAHQGATVSAGSTPGASAAGPGGRRIAWILVAAVVLLAVLHVGAVRQAPVPNAYAPPSLASMEGWMYPIEWNAPQRLPAVSVDLQDVAVVPEGGGRQSGNVWAVGDEGMVLRRSGSAWQQDTTVQRVLTSIPGRENCRAYDPTTVDAFVDRGGRVVLQASRGELFRAPVDASPEAVAALARAHTSVCVLGPLPGGDRVLTPGAIVYWKGRASEAAWASRAQGPCTSYDPGRLRVEGASGAWDLVATRADGVQTVLREAENRAVAEQILVLARRQSAYCPLGGAPAKQPADQQPSYRQQAAPMKRQGMQSSDARAPAAGAVRLASLGASEPQAQALPPVVLDTWTWPPGAPNLRRVQFAEDGTGWMAGPRVVLQTTDGGATWAHAPEPFPEPEAIGSAFGAAVGAPAAQVPEAQSPESQTPAGPSANGSEDRIVRTAFATDTEGWAVGAQGLLLHTTDGGATWTPALRPARTVRALRRSRSVWIAFQTGPSGRDPGLWRSDDDRTWRRYTTLDTSVVDVHFAGQTGYALTSAGRVLVSEDRGRTWTARAAGVSGVETSVQVAAIDASEPSGLWLAAVAEGGGTVAWRAPGRGASGGLTGVRPAHLAAVDSSTAWLVGRSADGSDRLFRTTNGGQAWTETGSPPEADRILDIVAPGPQTLWIVGAGGLLRVSRDGGETWTAPESVPEGAPDLHTLSVGRNVGSGGGTAIAAGTGQAAWWTTDGGVTWTAYDLVPYARWPAPWYYLAVLLVAGGTVTLLLRIHAAERPVEEQESVADRLMSDRPLRQGDPDALDLGRIASGLSRFMRNAKTEPPLTVAVTGAWGSGKSSLMNLLQDDLRAFDFQPVWFNAWHHQKEEHLLAALLENVRSQALPPFWTRAGAAFRLRLLWLRTRRHVPVVLACVFVFLGAVGLFAHGMADQAAGRALVDQIGGLLSGRADWTALVKPLGTLGVMAGSVVSLLVLLGRGLTAFGVTPAVLMASLRSNARVRDLRAQTGFRYHFQQAFREVTAALNPRTMVIFIDDLDRCRPSNVLEVLEAVNFLVDSGDCFVVLGLDLDRVQHYVQMGFRDVDEEGFAAHYLEKLINIEVPVPQATGSQLLQVVLPEGRSGEAENGTVEAAAEGAGTEESEAEREAERKAHERRVRQVQRGLRGLRIGVVAAALLAIAVWSLQGVADLVTVPEDASTDPAVVASRAERGTGARGGTTGDPAEAPPPGESTAETTTGEGAPTFDRTVARVESGAPRPAPWDVTHLGWVVGPLFVLLATGTWLLVQPAGGGGDDSPEFEAAIEIWHSVLVEHVETPRGIKRFMNRVRYYAMHLRPPDPPETIARQIAGWWTPPPDAPDRRRLREEMLVAICVLHTAGALQALVADAPSGDGASSPEAVSDTVAAALEAHAERFGDVRPAVAAWEHRLDEVLFDADVWEGG